MADGGLPARAGAVRWIALQTVVCLGLVALLYHRAVGFYFVGDDVGFVRPDPHWLRTLFLPSGEWHFYPLNTATFAVLGILSHGEPAPLHLLNLVLHAGVGIALATWLERFGLGAWPRLLVAMFFVSRGIHYEVVTWITELSYLAVSLYTILTLACWDRYLRGGSRGFLAGATAGFALGVLTIEHALLIAPACLLYDLLLGPSAIEVATPAGAGRWTRHDGRTLAIDALKYAPFVLVAVSFLAIKHLQHVGLTWSSASGAAEVPPVTSGMDLSLRLAAERTWHGFLNTPLRAYRDLLSATSYLFLPSALCYGADDTWLTRHPWLVLVPWLGIQLWTVWKGPPLARFLLAWAYVYELPLAVASVPQARYHYMASMPAAALVGLGLAAAHRRAGARGGRAFGIGAAALMIAMVAGEARFIGARLDEWQTASDMVRAAVTRLQTGLPQAAGDLYLVNLPRGVPGPYGPAYSFANAAAHLPLMLHPPRHDVRTHVVYDRSFVDDRWPTIGRYLPREAIERAARSGTATAFEFTGRPPWLAPVGTP